MAEWRLGRGWSEPELQARLGGLHALPRNFAGPIERMTPEHGWHQYGSEAVVAREAPGAPVPDGPFFQGRTAVAHYEFSDPRIVIAHFDPDGPLAGRRMLLEMRALRGLHYLGGVVVGAVRSEATEQRSVFGFRYDTLAGHIESGVEWFVLTKEHATGEVRFRISASWRRGSFPNWWSALGFTVFGPVYQRIWHYRAHAILSRRIQGPPDGPPPRGGGGLVHITPDVVFTRTRARDA